MAVNKKKVESTTTKKVKNYGKEYIQDIRLDVENSKPLTLTFEQLVEKLKGNKRYETSVAEGRSVATTCPIGFWKHNLPENAVFTVEQEFFKILIY